MRFLFYLLSSIFYLLWAGCVSSPDKPPRPEGTNIEITRPAVQGKILGGADVTVLWGHIPLLAIRGGQTRYGALEPGTYRLKATSPDPYRFSDYSQQTWESPVFQLVIEKGKEYKLEIVPGPGQGWIIRPLPPD